MAKFPHSLSLLRCQASQDIKTDPPATTGHDCKKEAQQGTERPIPKAERHKDKHEEPIPRQNELLKEIQEDTFKQRSVRKCGQERQRRTVL